jgi:hypothetical protein
MNSATSLNTTVGALGTLQVSRGETPSGLVNGTNAVFTVANTPIAGTFSLSVNGIKLKVNIDYSLAGNTATLTVADIPQAGDRLLADYQFSVATSAKADIRSVTLPIPITGVAGLSSALNQISTNLGSLGQELTSINAAVAAIPCRKTIVGETPGGLLNGVNTGFTLSDNTAVSSTIALFDNGMRLTPNLDYTVNQTLITFLSASIPQSGDILSVDYCALQ